MLPVIPNPDPGSATVESMLTSSALGRRLPPAPKSPAQDLSPLSASGFFSQALEVTPRGSSTAFRVYLTPPNPQASPNASTPTRTPTALAAGPSPPHAGPSGSSSSSTSPAPATKATPATSGAEQGKAKGTYLVCHHGAGAGGLSFAALAKEVTEKSAGEMGVLAYDARGHGEWTRLGLGVWVAVSTHNTLAGYLLRGSRCGGKRDRSMSQWQAIRRISQSSECRCLNAAWWDGEPRRRRLILSYSHKDS